MGLKITPPTPIVRSNITTTNVVNATDWNSVTDWVIDDAVSYNDSLYIAVQESGPSTTVQIPSRTNTLYWTYFGPVNDLRAFDRQVGVSEKAVSETYTTAPNSIEYTLDGLGAVTAVHFIGVTGLSITVQATETVQGDIVNETYTLDEQAILDNNLWRYLNAPFERETEHTFDGIYIPENTTINFTVDNGSDTAELSNFVAGFETDYGRAVDEIGVGEGSAGYFERDGDLITFVSRPSAEQMDFKVLARTDNSGLVRALRSLATTAAVYRTTAREYAIIYGRISDRRTAASAAGYDITSVQIERT